MATMLRDVSGESDEPSLQDLFERLIAQNPEASEEELARQFLFGGPAGGTAAPPRWWAPAPREGVVVPRRGGVGRPQGGGRGPVGAAVPGRVGAARKDGPRCLPAERYTASSWPQGETYSARTRT